MSYSASYKRYWDQRAQACTQFGDEGACLAQVARHVPVTIGGLGQTDQTGRDIGQAVAITAGLFTNPDLTLRQHGPPIVAAADQHIVTPIVDRLGESMAPYIVKYLIPPLALLYVISGVGAVYAYRAAQRSVRPNRRRRSGHKRRSSRSPR